MPRRDGRPTVTLKLRPNKDRDLEDWWNSLAKQSRSDTVRLLLRRGLGLVDDVAETEVPYQSPAASISPDQVEELRREMVQDMMDSWARLVQELLGKLPAYVQPLVEQALAQQGLQAGGAAGEDLISEAEAAQRFRNIKESKW